MMLSIKYLLGESEYRKLYHTQKLLLKHFAGVREICHIDISNISSESP